MSKAEVQKTDGILFVPGKDDQWILKYYDEEDPSNIEIAALVTQVHDDEENTVDLRVLMPGSSNAPAIRNVPHATHASDGQHRWKNLS